MPSPLDTSVKFIASWMPGAPEITSSAVGGFLAAMDILVDGADERTGSISVTSGLATLTFSGGAHMATQHAVILVSGSGDASLNGEQKVLTSTSGEITFPTNAPNGTYTCTFKLAPMGRERPFTGTNKRVYRSLDVTSERMYLRVEHSTVAVAAVRMYRDMTSVDAGTDMIPDTVTQTNYNWSIRTESAPGNAPYIIVTNGKSMHVAVEWAFNTTNNYAGGSCYFFGPIISKPEIVDPNNTLICGSTNTDVSPSGIQAVGSTNGGEYLSKEYTGIGSFKRAYFGLTGSASTDTWSIGYMTNFGNIYPDPITGSLYANEILVSGGSGIFSGGIRGKVPGILIIGQSAAGVFQTGSFIEINGKTYVTFRHASYASTSPTGTQPCFIDIEGPWA